MIKVYIASPYTKGDVAVNVKRQMDIADILISHGLAPFVPLYYHFQHLAHPRPYANWTKLDMEWIKSCDYMLRLSGESTGADEEVKLAKTLNIPVYNSIGEMFVDLGITIAKDFGKCKHENAYPFHENAPRYCPQCYNYVD